MLRDLPGQRLDVDAFEQARAAEGAVDFDGAFDEGLADLVLGHGGSPFGKDQPRISRKGGEFVKFV